MIDLKKFDFSGTTISGATPRSFCLQKVSYVNMEQNCTLNPKIILTMVKSDAQLLMQFLKSPKNRFLTTRNSAPSGRSKKIELNFQH
jgi:hypothetical protein